jgi:hypothetical protein
MSRGFEDEDAKPMRCRCSQVNVEDKRGMEGRAPDERSGRAEQHGQMITPIRLNQAAERSSSSSSRRPLEKLWVQERSCLTETRSTKRERNVARRSQRSLLGYSAKQKKGEEEGQTTHLSWD